MTRHARQMERAAQRQRRKDAERAAREQAAEQQQRQQADQDLIERSWKDGFLVGYSVAVEEVDRGNVVQAIATALLAKVSDRYQGATEIAKAVQRAMRPQDPRDVVRGCETAFRARFPATDPLGVQAAVEGAPIGFNDETPEEGQDGEAGD